MTYMHSWQGQVHRVPHREINKLVEVPILDRLVLHGYFLSNSLLLGYETRN